jgi:hypothetical protein
MASSDQVVLRYLKETTLGTTPNNGTKAAGTLTSTGVNVSNGDTVTLDGKVYTFQTVLTNVDGNVKIGASAALSLQNLFNAINRNAGVPGTDYAVLMSAHLTMDAITLTATTIVLNAKRTGTGGNALATTEVAVTLSFGSGTLTGGAISSTTLWKILRYMNENLVHNIENVTTQEITPTRVETDLIQTAISGQGGFNAEFSYSSFTDFLAAALAGVWSGGTNGNLDNGIILSSYSLQKQFQDMTPQQFHTFTGWVCDGFELGMEVGKIITVNFTGMAFGLGGIKNGVDTAQIEGASDTAAPTTSPFSAVSNLQNITIDGVTYSGCVMSMKARAKNNVRAIKCVGTPRPRDMKFGKFQFTGDLNLYFNEGTNYAKFAAGQAFSLAFDMIDAAGNKYSFTLPNCKFETAEVVSGGTNTDVMMNATFRALYDATTTRVIRIVGSP